MDAVDSMAKNYYTILGVKRDASEKDIRQAYRRLARKHHPDVNPGDSKAEGRFKEINEAYQVLSDAESRKKYDAYGDNWKYADQFGQGQRSGPFTYTRRTTGPGGGDDLSDLGLGDLFSGMFGRGGTTTGRRPRARRLEHPVEVSLEEAFSGTTRILRVQTPQGQEKRLEVKVPPGVETGAKVRIPAPDVGDVFLLVTVQPHARFERQGADLTTEAPAPLTDAVLGGEVAVQTLKGHVALTIPPESQNGNVFRLKGQGMPHLANPDRRGDLLVKIRVTLPTGLSELEKALFRDLRASREERDSGEETPTPP